MHMSWQLSWSDHYFSHQNNWYFHKIWIISPSTMCKMCPWPNQSEMPVINHIDVSLIWFIGVLWPFSQRSNLLARVTCLEHFPHAKLLKRFTTIISVTFNLLTPKDMLTNSETLTDIKKDKHLCYKHKYCGIVYQGPNSIKICGITNLGNPIYVIRLSYNFILHNGIFSYW